MVDIYDRLSQIYRERDEVSSYYDLRESIAQIYERQAKFHDAILEYLHILESNLIDSEQSKAKRLFPVVIDLYFKENALAKQLNRFYRWLKSLHKFGRIFESILVLEQVEEIQARMELSDQRLETLNHMRELYLELEDGEMIVDCYRRRIQILQEEDRADEAVDEMFQLINHYLESGDVDRAMEQFEEVESMDPEDSSRLFSYSPSVIRSSAIRSVPPHVRPGS